MTKTIHAIVKTEIDFKEQCYECGLGNDRELQ